MTWPQSTDYKTNCAGQPYPAHPMPGQRAQRWSLWVPARSALNRKTLRPKCPERRGSNLLTRKPKAEKPPYSGYFLAFERRRTAKIAQSLNYPGEASESFSAMDWTFERREIA